MYSNIHNVLTALSTSHAAAVQLHAARPGRMSMATHADSSHAAPAVPRHAVVGSLVVVLVADNHATKMSVRIASALLRPRDELLLLTVVMSEEGRAFGQQLLSKFAPPEDRANPCTTSVSEWSAGCLLHAASEGCGECVCPPSSPCLPPFSAPPETPCHHSPIPYTRARNPHHAHPLYAHNLCIGDQVLVKPERMRMADAIHERVASLGAALLVCGSHNLCAPVGEWMMGSGV